MKPLTTKRLGSIALAFALVLSVVPAPSNAGVLATSDVFARTGKTIDAWGAAWWQWAFAHPEVLGDTTGAPGPLGNVGGPVFFAEGSSGGAVTLDYPVPGNQFILLPVATYLWTLFDPCAATDCAADIVNGFANGASSVFATIDGVAVPALGSHIVLVDKTAPLVFQIDAGPIQPDGFGGILDAVEAGYWLMLEPLSSGTHVLTFGATVPSIDPFTGEFLDGTDNLSTTLRLQAIPEPSSGVLLCAGLLAWALARRALNAGGLSRAKPK